MSERSDADSATTVLILNRRCKLGVWPDEVDRLQLLFGRRLYERGDTWDETGRKLDCARNLHGCGWFLAERARSLGIMKARSFEVPWVGHSCVDGF